MSNSNQNGNHDGDGRVTEYCVLCRRPDTTAGKMIHMPGNLRVCPDCMQRMMDFAGKMDLSGIPGDPGMMQNLFQMFGNPFGGGNEKPAEPSRTKPQESGGSRKAKTGKPGKDLSETEKVLSETKKVLSETDEAFSETEKAEAAEAIETAESAETLEPGGTPSGAGFAGEIVSGADLSEKRSAPEALPNAAGQTEETEEDDEDGQEDGSEGYQNGPSIRFLNLGDLFGTGGGFGNRGPKVKKKKKKIRKPVFSIDSMPAPHKIKEELDKYVIGQERAKKFISVAAYNHYKRVRTGTMDEIEIEKSNILLIGPTGCGKTYLVRTLAELLDVPLAISDATALTEAGYIGDDIESVVSKLLAAADNDIEKAEKGIVFIDEIDKIAKKRNTNSRDVSGESVQQGLLKLLEGAEIEVPVGASSKNAMVPLATVNTRNILFICGGAFPNLETIIRERLRKKTSMGFGATLKNAFDDDRTILDNVTNEDLRNFGMIPEFIGRLPIVCTLQGLDEEMLVRILREPRNAILRQYQKLLALDEVDLRFEDDALEAIASKALARDTGARALRSVIEEFMMDIMYEIPKDDNIGTVTITRAFVEGTGGPVIGIRQDFPRQIAMTPSPAT